MKRSDNDAPWRATDNHRLVMKTVPLIAAISALLGAVANPSLAAESEGVALAIVYDTSGSMKETVLDANRKPTPKYLIANRALIAIAQQIHTFATNSSDAPKKIDAGLFIFSGSGAREAIPFGQFKAEAFQDWARTYSNPSGNTPLGTALDTAAQTVLRSPLPRKHVLVITDGQNTVGPQPATVMPKIQQLAQGKGSAVSVHFVAFDVAAKIFDPVKRLGATVVGAGNEAELNTQLHYILQRKILLEEEEPPKK